MAAASEISVTFPPKPLRIWWSLPRRKGSRALLLTHPYLVRGEIPAHHYMRSDDDKQLVILFHLIVIDQALIQAGDGGNRRDSIDRALVVRGDFTRHHGRFSIAQPDA